MKLLSVSIMFFLISFDVKPRCTRWLLSQIGAFFYHEAAITSNIQQFFNGLKTRTNRQWIAP
jgi:hypothetical protein